jgi:hypothetical protein
MQSKQTTYARFALIGLLAGLLFAGLIFAAGETIPRSAVTGGGGTLSASGVALQAAVGQPVAGAVGSATTLCSGLICGAGVSAPPPTPGPSPTPGPTATPGPSPDAKLFLPLTQR